MRRKDLDFLHMAVVEGWRPVRDTLRFHGRAQRGELVVYFIAVMLLHILVAAVAGPDLRIPLFANVSVSADLIYLLPMFAWITRRSHDYGMPGWPAPILLGVWIIAGQYRDWLMLQNQPQPLWLTLVFWTSMPLILAAMLWRPNVGPNLYGPDPRGPELGRVRIPTEPA